MYEQNYELLAKAEADKEKGELRRYGILGGICVIGFLLVQEILSSFLYFFDLYELYQNDMLFQQAVGLFITLFAICVPFLICGQYEKKYSSYEILPLDKPKDTVSSILAVPAGVALCLIGSYLTSYITLLLEAFGLKLSSPDLSLPTSGFETVIYLLRLTVVAAVIEEISFRGVILQPLRKYGDWFAIAMSSIIFGLVHCNLIQAPFAIVAGLAIGYFTVTTGSLWTGILIHFFNNSISALITYLSSAYGENTANAVGNVIVTLTVIIGIVCLVFFFMRNGGASTHGKKTFISKGEKVKAYLVNVPMILAFIAICWYTHYYISL